MERRLLSVSEMAEYTGLSVNTLYTWVSQRKVPFVKMGRLTRFDRIAIDHWIDANKNETQKF